MSVMSASSGSEPRVKMYIRVRPSIKHVFKTITHIQGDTVEGRIERFMEEHNKEHRKLVPWAGRKARR